MTPVRAPDEDADGPGHRTPPHKRRVLLVDDDPAIREAVGLLLQSAGYEVHTALDGEDALQLLSDDSHPVPDAIVTDACMPRRSGPELLREIAPNLRFRGVWTILISSDHLAGRNVRCHAFIAKDRVSRELIDTLLRLELTPPNVTRAA